MALPVEITTRMGVGKDDIDYGYCRKWLTPIVAHAIIHPDETEAPIRIGEALGFIICREAIDSDFHESMEPPHEGTGRLALDLFDRFGRLKEDIREHPLRKGSGVWKRELDDGNLVLIEDVQVERQYRRKGVASKLVLEILEQAMGTQRNVDYAFSRAAAYYSDDYGMGNESSSAPHHTKIERVVSFLRSLQFRRVGLTSWFALARDVKHPSRNLTRDEDPDPIREVDDLIDSDSDEEVILCDEDFTSTTIQRSEWESQWLGISPKPKPAIATRARPLHYVLKTLPDKDALAFLESHAQNLGSAQANPEALDGRGDTVVHIAAKASKSRCLEWLLRQPIIATLLQATNYAGYTPLEALQAQLETRRVHRPYGFERQKLLANEFDGFDEEAVTCLLMLQGVMEPSPDQRLRAKFGCTCKMCLEGFMSPRMLMKLGDQAQEAHGFMTHLTPPGHKDWYMEFKGYLGHLSGASSTLVRDSKELQIAVVLLMSAIADCLSRKKIPHEATVIEILQTTKAWANVERHYFEQGGTVYAIVATVFDYAKLHDLEVGHAMIDVEPEEYYKGVPECRNDLEFEFVRRHCYKDVTAAEDVGKRLPVQMPWLTEMFRLRLEGKDPFEDWHEPLD